MTPAPPNLHGPQAAADGEPWLGLDSFREDQAGLFFGRSEVCGELLRLIKREPLGVLFGQSGLGKTSLLRAGLFPRLRAEGFLPVYVRLDHAPSAPPLAEQTAAALHAAAIEAGLVPSPRLPGDSLWSHLHRAGGEFWSAHHDLVTPVVVFDQFEEIFTLGGRDGAALERRNSLLATIAELALNIPPPELQRRCEQEPELQATFDFGRQPCRLVLTLREDYLADLDGLRLDFRALTRSRLRLLPMNGVQALAAVVNPGRRAAGELVSEEVGEMIVRFVAKAGPEAPLESIQAVPPFLSLMCRELNRRRIEAGLATIEARLVDGSQSNVLRAFYDSCFEGLPGAAREFVEDGLLSPGGHREMLTWESACSDLVGRGVSDPGAVLSELEKRRLVTAGERGGQRRIELTHDLLTLVARPSRDERLEKRWKRDLEEKQRNTVRQRRRSQRLAGAMSVLALAAAAGAAFSWFGYRKLRRTVGSLSETTAALQSSEESARQKRTQLAEVTAQVTTARGELQRQEEQLNLTRARFQTESERGRAMFDFLQSEAVQTELSKRNPDGLAVSEMVQKRIAEIYPAANSDPAGLRAAAQTSLRLARTARDDLRFSAQASEVHYAQTIRSSSRLVASGGGHGPAEIRAMEAEARVELAELLADRGKAREALETLAALPAGFPEPGDSVLAASARLTESRARSRLGEPESALAAAHAAQTLLSGKVGDPTAPARARLLVEVRRQLEFCAGRAINAPEFEQEMIELLLPGAGQRPADLESERAYLAAHLNLSLAWLATSPADVASAKRLPGTRFESSAEPDATAAKTGGGVDAVVDALLRMDEADPTSAEVAELLARGYDCLGKVALGEEQPAIAASHFQHARELALQVLEARRESPQLARLLVDVNEHLASLRANTSDRRRAYENYLEAYRLLKPLLSTGPTPENDSGHLAALGRRLVSAAVYFFFEELVGQGSPLEEISFFDEPMDYFGQPQSSRQSILVDIQRYRKRYPYQIWRLAREPEVEWADSGATVRCLLQHWLSSENNFKGVFHPNRVPVSIVMRFDGSGRPVMVSIRESK